ncbi:MAG: hypothetical protein R3348_03890 [Xanthomonadales bacterium]|nr:hypothetical protein [Xanthomonadales bacterium]
MNQSTSKAPVHLWVVGVLALLWNAMGAFDYSATHLRMDAYMSQFTAAQLEYFYGFPAWAVAGWAVAVWAGLVGSIGLLMRKAWSVWMFGASVAGMIVTTIYNFGMSNGAEIMGTAAVWFSVAIWVIALFLFFYARSMAARGILT